MKAQYIMSHSRDPSVLPRQSSKPRSASLPPILSKPKEKNFRKPPTIEVAMNKRALYKPYSMMYGDNISDLAHLEHTELTAKTKTRNKLEVDRCWKSVNLSYRDHLYAMSGLRQGQSMVYQLMCKVNQDKRRIQRQAHRKREKEFQKKMQWDRIKHMCRYVVFKFKENVKIKKKGRLKEIGIKPRVTSMRPIQPPTQQNVTDTNPPNYRDSRLGEVTRQDFRKNVLEHAVLDTLEEEANIEDIEETEMVKTAMFLKLKSKSETNILSPETKPTVVHTKAYASYKIEQSMQSDDKGEHILLNKELANEKGVFVEGLATDAQISSNTKQCTPRETIRSRVIQVRKDKSVEPLTRELQVQKTGAQQTDDKQPKTHVRHGSAYDVIRQSVNGQEDDPDMCEPNLSKELSLVKPNTALNPVRSRRLGNIRPPDSYFKDNMDRSSKSANQIEEWGSENDSSSQVESICKEANLKYKDGRESLVVLIKKRARARVKKDLDSLNKESFVRYERTKSGLLKAFEGKRDVFLPPTTKNRYTRNKLLKQEREAILLQQIKLAKFFESIMEMRDKEIIHKTSSIVEESSDKELPNLADLPSQMSNSIFNVIQPAQNVGLENRYVRVFDRSLKEQERVQDRRMSSWNM